MKSRGFRSLYIILAVAILIQLTNIGAVHSATSKKLEDTSFSAAVNIGDPIQNIQITANCFGKNALGNDVFYGITNGILFAYDLDAGAITDTKDIKESNALDMGDDGVINIATGSNFYRYNPQTKELKNYGSISPETAVMHRGCFDGDGNYYFGTYPNAALFKYDKATDTLTKIKANAVEGKYIRAISGYGNKIYMGGVGTEESPAKLTCYNTQTGVFTDIPGPTWADYSVHPGDIKNYYSMSHGGKYIYMRFTCFNASVSYCMGVYDSEAEEFVDFVLGTTHLHATDLDDEGLSYMRGNGTRGTRTFIAYSPSEKRVVADYDGLSGYSGYIINPKTLTLKDQVTYPGKTVVFGASSEGIALFNLQNQTMTFILDPIPTSSYGMRTIRGGYNNEIIASSYASTKLVIYDAAEQEIIKELPLSQMEGINVFDSKYYISSYGGSCTVREIDPQNDYAYVSLADMSGAHQDRAFVLENAGDYIIWGSVPDYGYRGGAVGVYHKENKTKAVYSGIFGTQSISGLSYKDGYIYGSTNMFCGLGIDPVTTTARIFKMDIQNGNIVAWADVTLSTDSTQYFAGGMSFGPDGGLYMACSQRLVEVDTNTLAIKREMSIGSLSITPTEFRWQPFAMEWSYDGLLYTNIGEHITAVDVDTWESKTIGNTKTAMLTIGSDSNIYYMSNSNLSISRITVTKTSSNGEGTIESPYEISTAEQLMAIANFPDMVYKQTANITVPLNTPIPNFSGVYDGNGYSIALSINSGANGVGLFAQADGASISGVTVTGSVSGGMNTGGIVGIASNGTSITDCVNNASITSESVNIGGIAGNISADSVLSGCANYGDVLGASKVGGISGYMGAEISNSFNMGNITASTDAGGIAGMAVGTIRACYNLGDITGNTASGMAKLTDNESAVLALYGCYNAGRLISVDKTQKMGNIALASQSIAAEKCYYISASGYEDETEGVQLVNTAELILADLGSAYEIKATHSRLPQLKTNPQNKDFKLTSVLVSSKGGGAVQDGIHYLYNDELIDITPSPFPGFKIKSFLYNGSNYTGGKNVLISNEDSDIVINVEFEGGGRGYALYTYPQTYKESDKLITFGAVAEGAGDYTLLEYGIVLSKTQTEPELNLEECTKFKADEQNNTNGRFGIELTGVGAGTGGAYYTRSYAIYINTSSKITVIYADTLMTEF